MTRQNGYISQKAIRRNTLETADRWFWPKVNREGDCWLWTGYVSPVTGNGQVRAAGKLRPAHKVTWLLAGREIPAGTLLRHTCGTGHCVRLDHLELYVPPVVVRSLKRGEANPLGLTAEEIREYLAIDCCPICGEGPWKAVASHFRTHGYKADEIKRWAGLNRTMSLISVEYREQKSDIGKALGADWLGQAPGPKGKRWGARCQALETIAESDGVDGTLVELNVEHGSFRGYQKGCRCKRCRLANSERHHRNRERRSARQGEIKNHGTTSTYTNWNCRCEPCSAAWAEHMRTRTQRKHVSDLLAAHNVRGPGAENPRQIDGGESDAG